MKTRTVPPIAMLFLICVVCLGHYFYLVGVVSYLGRERNGREDNQMMRSQNCFTKSQFQFSLQKYSVCLEPEKCV